MLTKLMFMPPTQNEDGSALVAANICGYEARVDGGAAFALTDGAIMADGRWVFPFAQLGVPAGVHTVEVRTAAKDGQRSKWSAVLSVTQVVLPNPPSLLSAE